MNEGLVTCSGDDCYWTGAVTLFATVDGAPWDRMLCPACEVKARAFAPDASYLAGFEAAKAATLRILDQYRRDNYDDDSSRAAGATECAGLIYDMRVRRA